MREIITLLKDIVRRATRLIDGQEQDLRHGTVVNPGAIYSPYCKRRRSENSLVDGTGGTDGRSLLFMIHLRACFKFFPAALQRCLFGCFEHVRISTASPARSLRNDLMVPTRMEL